MPLSNETLPLSNKYNQLLYINLYSVNITFLKKSYNNNYNNINIPGYFYV